MKLQWLSESALLRQRRLCSLTTSTVVHGEPISTRLWVIAGDKVGPQLGLGDMNKQMGSNRINAVLGEIKDTGGRKQRQLA